MLHLPWLDYHIRNLQLMRKMPLKSDENSNILDCGLLMIIIKGSGEKRW